MTSHVVDFKGMATFKMQRPARAPINMHVRVPHKLVIIKMIPIWVMYCIVTCIDANLIEISEES